MYEQIKDFKEKDLTFFLNRYEGMDIDLVLPFVAFMKRLTWILSSIESYFAHNNLSHGRFGMLLELMRRSETGDVSPAELAKIYGAKSATITGLLDHLERDDLIERVPNPEDRRKINVKLTEAGFAFMDDFLPRHQRMMAKALDEMSDEERSTLIFLLSKIHQGIHAHLQEYQNDNE